MKYKCLSIAGFDGSGGAGLQADIKTFSATGTYGMSILTALPVQNTCGVKSFYEVPLQCIDDQLHVLFDDIRPDAIKIGMLFSTEIIELMVSFLKERAYSIPIVLDPVMLAKSGDILLKKDAIETLKTKLIPMVNVITPNLPEAICLIPGHNEKRILAKKLLDLGCQAILLKGGHENSATADDLFLSHDEEVLLSAKRINSKNTHGTGCTLSAAIASFIAQGWSYIDACKQAKIYLTEALFAAKDEKIGKGCGPVNHFYQFK